MGRRPMLMCYVIFIAIRRLLFMEKKRRKAQPKPRAAPKEACTVKCGSVKPVVRQCPTCRSRSLRLKRHGFQLVFMPLFYKDLLEAHMRSWALNLSMQTLASLKAVNKSTRFRLAAANLFPSIRLLLVPQMWNLGLIDTPTWQALRQCCQFLNSRLPQPGTRTCITCCV